MQNVMTDRINKWAIERNLHNADPAKQILKLGEEYGELCEALLKNRKRAAIKDSIGDIYVVLTILCLQMDLDLDECIEAAYDEIRDRKGMMIDGSFVKESDLHG